MNDLLQLRRDMEKRYGSVVQGRRSLRDLQHVVGDLADMLKADAAYLIKPPSSYWAVLSNAVAGAVQETQTLLTEGANLAMIPTAGRLLFFFCLGMGYDADVNEIRHIFITIKDIVSLSTSKLGMHELVAPLQKVNTLKYQTYVKRMNRMLSDIQEEPYIQVAN